jgi:hypothetical protein
MPTSWGFARGNGSFALALDAERVIAATQQTAMTSLMLKRSSSESNLVDGKRS